VSAGPKFCSSCGHPLNPGDSFCSSCGAPVAATAETQPDPAEPLTGEQSNLVPCPGCVQTWGVPGALCPACGSRYGDPSMKQPMKILGLVGVILVGIALLLNDVSEGAANVVGAIGVLSLVLAAFAYASYTGRVGPQRQGSCCGCSCAVALLLIPAAGLALWSQGGADMAAFALPASLPLSWAIARIEHGVRAIGLGVSRRS
jgi:hypothetical protein